MGQSHVPCARYRDTCPVSLGLSCEIRDRIYRCKEIPAVHASGDSLRSVSTTSIFLGHARREPGSHPSPVRRVRRAALRHDIQGAAIKNCVQLTGDLVIFPTRSLSASWGQRPWGMRVPIEFGTARLPWSGTPSCHPDRGDRRSIQVARVFGFLSEDLVVCLHEGQVFGPCEAREYPSPASHSLWVGLRHAIQSAKGQSSSKLLWPSHLRCRGFRCWRAHLGRCRQSAMARPMTKTTRHQGAIAPWMIRRDQHSEEECMMIRDAFRVPSLKSNQQHIIPACSVLAQRTAGDLRHVTSQGAVIVSRFHFESLCAHIHFL